MIIPLAYRGIEDPLKRTLPDMDEVNIKVAVEFSGGVESATSLIYVKRLGLKSYYSESGTIHNSPYLEKD